MNDTPFGMPAAMLNRCPNCDESVPCIVVLKSTHTCRACGCLLGLRTTSEILAFGIWVAFVMLVGAGRSSLFDWPWYAACPALAATYLLSRYLFEQFVVRARPGLSCLECGYLLKGLTKNRCPECGTPFPESAIERIRQHIHQPETQSKSGSIVMIAALLLVGALIVASLLLNLPRSGRRPPHSRRRRPDVDRPCPRAPAALSFVAHLRNNADAAM